VGHPTSGTFAKIFFLIEFAGMKILMSCAAVAHRQPLATLLTGMFPTKEDGDPRPQTNEGDGQNSQKEK
jgi:hypothetical protein